MNPIYFESVAKNKVDILHRVHIDEIETKLNKNSSLFLTDKNS
ncbi:hypothetical protein NHP194004_15510 [Helicobacter suis]|nr:hypothetical protein NHP194004_15510 [Helicobacter suis]